MDSRYLFEGTAARQIDFVEAAPAYVRRAQAAPRPRLQPLVKDLYKQLDLRRRRAQIAARKYVV